MKKNKTLAIVLLAILVASFLTACGNKSDSNKVTIWTSGEDYKNEYYLTELQKKFPEYDITMEYMNSSTIAAKVMEEGANCSCDIILSEEYGYLEKCSDNLTELKNFDFSLFLDEIVPTSHKYSPELKNGGCIIVNNDVLTEKDLPTPTCYADLLDPAFKDMISMPSPASSGTGYMFLRQLTNEWGEEEAFSYFEKLTDNILQYTSSGSGPVNALVQGEVAVGLGMISQAVTEKNEGVNLEILFFEEGAPYSMYGNAVLAKSADRVCVMDVFNYLAVDLAKGDNERYFPDQIFKDFTPEVEGFPKNIKYGNMSNDTLEEKERLLSSWIYS